MGRLYLRMQLQQQRWKEALVVGEGNREGQNYGDEIGVWGDNIYAVMEICDGSSSSSSSSTREGEGGIGKNGRGGEYIRI